MLTRTAQHGLLPPGPRTEPVGVEPLTGCLLQLLPLLAAWGRLLLGRALCLVTQRVPPVVWAVRAARQEPSAGRMASRCVGRE